MKLHIKKVFNTIKKFLINNYIIIALSFLATIFFCYPYLNKLNIQAHDITFHLTRIQQLSYSIKNHDILPMINFGLLNGLGYGNPIFYPQVFLYIPAILHVFGISTLMSYKVFIIIVTWFTFIIMFYCSNKIFDNKTTATITTLLYVFSLYRIVDVYTRAALGEILVFTFLPIIFLGCYEIFYNKSNKWYILPLGVFCIINSHILSILFVIGIIFFFMILNIKSLKDNFKNIIISGIMSILIILSVAVPIIEQKNENDYNVFTNGTSIDLTLNSLIPTQLFMNNYTYGFAKTPNSQINGQMSFSVGIILLLCPSFILFVKKKDNNKKYIMQCLILGIITLLMTTKIFPWKYFKYLYLIQIAWRLNVIVTASLSIVSSYALEHILKNKKELMYIFSIIIIIVSSRYLDNIQYSNERYKEIEYIDISQGEYLPSCNVKCEDGYAYEIGNKEKTYNYERKYNEVMIEVTQEKNSEKINIPYTFYKGYKAYIQTENGKVELKTKMNEENGLTIVENNNKLNGKISITYKKTLMQNISYMISYITLMFIIIYILKK